jgi:hypothetical protein
MSTKERIRILRILELAQKHPDYLQTLGVQCQIQTTHKHL